MGAFKIILIAVILSFILTFMYDYFIEDFITAMEWKGRKEDMDAIKKMFRFSIFCMLLMTFIFYGMITSQIILNNV